MRGRTFDTRAEANLALFEYIDGFHNPRCHPKAPRLPQPHRVRRETLRRPGSGRTSEPETTSTP
ncbi:hypothetical protein ACFYR1_51140 [Streptomyces canus]|uniref:hypothetical protein n=1 Tax=Streptomyces canus TaxID=58343 RepID=UPI003675DA46